MSDTVDSPEAESQDQSGSEDGVVSEAATGMQDPAATDHPTGHQQAAENEEKELPG
jgi:hypothetical protein